MSKYFFHWTVKLRHQLVSVIGVATIVVGVAAVAPTTRVFAAAPLTTVAASSTPCPASFFGLEPWWQYLPASDFGDPTNKCSITNFTVWPPHSDIPFVLLAITDDLLRIAGLVAVGFLIYAAISFITSQGNPEDAKKARGTAINALIGLVFAMIATVLVSFIGSKLGG